MLNLQPVQTDGAPAAIGPYSQGVAVNVSPHGVVCLLATAGQIGLDPASGQMVPGGVQAETEQAFRNLTAILAAQQLTLAHVVKTTVFLADINEYAAMNTLYAEFFPNLPPARSTPVVTLPKGLLMSIECIAMV